MRLRFCILTLDLDWWTIVLISSGLFFLFFSRFAETMSPKNVELSLNLSILRLNPVWKKFPLGLAPSVDSRRDNWSLINGRGAIEFSRSFISHERRFSSSLLEQNYSHHVLQENRVISRLNLSPSCKISSAPKYLCLFVTKKKDSMFWMCEF